MDEHRRDGHIAGDDLQRLADGDFAFSGAAGSLEHLETCAVCQRELEALLRVAAWLALQSEPPADLLTRARERRVHRQRRRSSPRLLAIALALAAAVALVLRQTVVTGVDRVESDGSPELFRGPSVESNGHIPNAMATGSEQPPILRIEPASEFYGLPSAKALDSAAALLRADTSARAVVRYSPGDSAAQMLALQVAQGWESRGVALGQIILQATSLVQSTTGAGRVVLVSVERGGPSRVNTGAHPTPTPDATTR